MYYGYIVMRNCNLISSYLGISSIDSNEVSFVLRA